MNNLDDTLRATCNECGFAGTLRALRLHDCYIALNGGRCEDYPCCGHTDGDGCQTRPEHTSDFYYDNPQFLHEPGSPEWYDAMDDLSEAEDEAWDDNADTMEDQAKDWGYETIPLI